MKASVVSFVRVLAAILVFCLVGQAVAVAAGQAGSADERGPAGQSAAPAGEGTKPVKHPSIMDDAGQIVTLRAPAKRVIPLYAGLGEILVSLGATGRIVGRTASDDTLPPDLPVVGTHMRPNPEIIAGLAPDLVVQFEGREEAALTSQSLMRLGIPVARFRITNFEELFACIRRLGVLLGQEKRAGDLEQSLRRRLDGARAVNAALSARPTVFFEVRYPNLLGAGAGGMVNDIILAAGGQNALAGHTERMVRLSEEALALANPDMYLVQQGAMNKAPLPPAQRSHFQGLAAVKRGFVRVVPESLYSRPGPGSVAAAEELAAYIRLWHAKTGH